MYWPKDEAALIAATAGFNTLLYTQPLPRSLGFTTLRCIGEVCVGYRPGGCSSIPVSALPMPTAFLETLATKTTPPAASERGNTARAARTGSNR
jgi:hypothetical protein